MEEFTWEIGVNDEWGLHEHKETKTKKAMAPHSSTLAWRIPGTEEPGGLPSMGHDWSDLAAAPARRQKRSIVLGLVKCISLHCIGVCTETLKLWTMLICSEFLKLDTRPLSISLPCWDSYPWKCLNQFTWGLNQLET